MILTAAFVVCFSVLARIHEMHFAVPMISIQMEENDPFERVNDAIIHKRVKGSQ